MRRKIFCLLTGLFSAGMGMAQGVLPDGFLYLEEGQFSAARSCFLQQLKNNPRNLDALNGLGDTYLALKNPDSAQVAFQQIISANPKNPYGLAGMGKVALTKKDQAGKTEYFERARRVDKMNPEVFCAIARGCLHQALPDTALARSYINQGLGLHPKYAALHLLTGDLETICKRYGPAINAYNRAIFFDPKSYLAYRNRGILELHSHAYRDALEAFTRSVAIRPEQIQVYRYLGDLYDAMGKNAEAASAWSTYISGTTPTNEEQGRYAIILFFNKQYHEAAAILDRMSEMPANEAVLMRIRGYIACETGDYTRGLAYLDRLFALREPEKIIATDYMYYAKLLKKSGKEVMAIPYLEKALLLDPSKTALAEELANLASGNKMHRLAANYYQKMLNQGADKVSTSFLIGKEQFFEGGIWKARLDSLKRGVKPEQTSPLDSATIRKTMNHYFTGADSTFTVVTQLNPAFAGGFIWKGRVQTMLDPYAESNLAKEAYEKALEILTRGEPSKNRKLIMECYRYLGSWYFHRYDRLYKSDPQKSGEMRSKCLEYFNMIRNLDPADAQASEVLSKMSGRNQGRK